MGKKRDSLNRLEAQITQVQNSIQNRFSAIDAQFSAMESKIDDRLSSVESQSSSIESSINDRLSAMEVLLLNLTERSSSIESRINTLLQNKNDISPVLAAEVEKNSSHAKSATGKRNTNEEDTITKIATTNVETANETSSRRGKVLEAELSESENNIANAILKLKNPPAPKDFVETESRLVSYKDNQDHVSLVLDGENHEPLKEKLVENNFSLNESENRKRKADGDDNETMKRPTIKRVNSTNVKEADGVGRESGEAASPGTSAEAASPGSSAKDLYNATLMWESPTASKGLVETESRLVSDEKEKKHFISVALAPKDHEPLTEMLVENDNSSFAKSAKGKSETNDANSKTATKSPETQKVNLTKGPKSTGDESGEIVQPIVLALPKSIRRVNQAGKEIKKAKVRSEELAENLVGSKISVFWPKDDEYYKGVVEAYDPATKRHKVSYKDGDVETLLLRREKWIRIEEDLVPDSGTKSKIYEVGKKVGIEVSTPSAKPITSVKSPLETESRLRWYQKFQTVALSGRCNGIFTLEVESSDTIKDIKAKIHSKKRYPPQLQILAAGSKTGFQILEEGEKTLGDYSIGKNSTIFVRNYIRMIHVRDQRNGMAFSLRVLKSDTISDVKAKIQVKVGMPANMQVLFFAGNSLVNNDSTLLDYDMYDECTLLLFPLSGIPGRGCLHNISPRDLKKSV